MNCWVHPYAPSGNGYVQSRQHSPDGRKLYVHRRAYELAFDVDLNDYPGLQIDHLCFNKACFNPDHLEVVTPSENTGRFHKAFPKAGPPAVRLVNRSEVCNRCQGPLPQIGRGRPRKYCEACVSPSHREVRIHAAR